MRISGLLESLQIRNKQTGSSSLLLDDRDMTTLSSMSNDMGSQKCNVCPNRNSLKAYAAYAHRNYYLVIQ